ncbi:similar to Saccharomyces cerevisiae YGL082W Putative protein of unknown function [Maudiozyma barnettii]|nr:similar to Saccharomyces cerevisiae YGL082W Putative protein of unknown function [Kazachstania barnettii]
MCIQYATKSIEYGKKKCSILLQNENGPCALIALVNVLLLDTQFENETEDLKTLVKDSKKVQQHELLEVIASIALHITKSKTKHDYIDTSISKEESDMSKLLTLLPNLNTGLNVNPIFDGTFEDSAELSLFRLFGVRLVHGWIIGNGQDENSELYKLSYDEALNMYAHADEISNNKGYQDNVNETCIFEKSDKLKSFLNDSSTQLTSDGICHLQKILPNNTLSVLFRNDHFATLLKRDDILYTLVTDLGYKMQSTIIWESLISTDSSLNDFYDSDFMENLPIHEDILTGKEMISDNNEMTSIDRKMALQLQEEEDRKMAKSMSKIVDQKHVQLKTKQTNKQHHKKTLNSERKKKMSSQPKSQNISPSQNSSTSSKRKSNSTCVIM